MINKIKNMSKADRFMVIMYILILTSVMVVLSDEIGIVYRNLKDEVTYAITGRTASQRAFDDDVDDICDSYNASDLPFCQEKGL